MKELRFDGRVAIVTGAGRGLGRAHALMLGERGAAVVVNDLGASTAGEGTDEAPAQQVAEEIRQAGGKAVGNTASVTTADGVRSIVDDALGNFGQIDIIVNNAGVVGEADFPDVGMDDLERHLSVHVVGSFNVTKAAWPHLVQRGYGRVVMTSSTSGLFGQSRYKRISYPTAKSALWGLTRELGFIGAPAGIKVNAITPFAYTRMAETGGVLTEEVKLLSERHRRPDQVSPVIAFLSHECCEVSGQVFSASSGRVANIFLAQTRGFVDLDLTPEAIRENWSTIVDRASYHVPSDALEEVSITLQYLRASGLPVAAERAFGVGGTPIR